MADFYNVAPATHQWFYKKDILEETEVVIKKQDTQK